MTLGRVAEGVFRLEAFRWHLVSVLSRLHHSALEASTLEQRLQQVIYRSARDKAEEGTSVVESKKTKMHSRVS